MTQSKEPQQLGQYQMGQIILWTMVRTATWTTDKCSFYYAKGSFLGRPKNEPSKSEHSMLQKWTFNIQNEPYVNGPRYNDWSNGLPEEKIGQTKWEKSNSKYCII